MKRISVYLDEDEVSEQVSALKKDSSSPQSSAINPEEDGLGFENASFEWNQVPESNDDDKKTSAKGKGPEPSTGSTSTIVDDTGAPVTASDSASTDLAASDGDRKFELRDLNIRFPEGELTLVTGPTASGKTAVLVRPRVYQLLCRLEASYFYRWLSLVK